MPIYLFWELVRNIDRLRAEEDQRLVVCFAQAFGGDIKDYIGRLNTEIGDTAITSGQDDAIDREGLRRVRALFMRS